MLNYIIISYISIIPCITLFYTLNMFTKLTVVGQEMDIMFFSVILAPLGFPFYAFGLCLHVLYGLACFFEIVDKKVLKFVEKCEGVFECLQ